MAGMADIVATAVVAIGKVLRWEPNGSLLVRCLSWLCSEYLCPGCCV